MWVSRKDLGEFSCSSPLFENVTVNNGTATTTSNSISFPSCFPFFLFFFLFISASSVCPCWVGSAHWILQEHAQIQMAWRQRDDLIIFTKPTGCRLDRLLHSCRFLFKRSDFLHSFCTNKGCRCNLLQKECNKPLKVILIHHQHQNHIKNHISP